MTERDEAIRLANKVLDRGNADPDDDLGVLARQFLRALDLWRPIVEAPRDETQFIARTRDGRTMIWSGRIFWQGRVTDHRTPDHLQFPATHFVLLTDLPALPQ